MARTTITNAGEFNGFLKPQGAAAVAAAALRGRRTSILPKAYRPALDRAAVERFTVETRCLRITDRENSIRWLTSGSWRNSTSVVTAARRMGGPEKLAQRKKRGQLNAQERLDALDRPRKLHRARPARRLGHRSRTRTRRRATRKITGFGRIDGRDVGVVVNDFTVKGSSTSATNSRKMGYIRRACTERGLPFVHIGEVDRRAPARRHGLQRHGAVARQRHHPVPSHPRDSLGGRGARHVVRLVRLAMLLRRLLGDEEGLDHGGVEPAPGVDGDRPEGRSGGARRLAAARRADRAHRPLRRHRRRGDGRDPPVPLLHAEPSPRTAARRPGCGRFGRERRSGCSTWCRRSARRSTT